MHLFLAALALLAVASTASAQQPALDQDPRLRDAVADVRRLGIATEVREARRGTLQITVGPAFAASSSVSYNLGRLHLAYTGHHRGYEGPVVLELLEGGEKIGEYTKDGLTLTRRPVERPAPRAVPAAAQKPSGRLGGTLYLSVGAGSGSADFLCEHCRFEMSPALAGYALLGLRVGRQTVLGVEGTGWTKSDATTRGRMYSLTATALGYFDDNLPLFLSGGVGLAGYTRDVPDGTVSANALGYSARLGLELRISGPLRLAPYAGLVGTVGRPEFRFEDDTPFGVAANFINLQFGTAITIN